MPLAPRFPVPPPFPAVRPFPRRRPSPVRRLFSVRRLAGLAVAAAGLAVLAACGAAPSGPATPSGAPPSPAGAPAGTSVTVEMAEYRLTVSQQAFTPGAYTFVARNTGHTAHALVIAGPGVAGERTTTVPPGQSAQVSVTLRGGSYELWCPIDGHKGMGMDTQITVGGSGGAGGAPSSGPAAPSTSAGGGNGGGYGY